MDFFAGASSEERQQIENLRQLARQKAAADEARDTAAESARRIRALPPLRRFIVDSMVRAWSTIAWALFGLSNVLPFLQGAAVFAGRRVLHPPAVWPELKERVLIPSRSEDPATKSAVYRALADAMGSLTNGGGLPIETTLQMEELVARIERGADAEYVLDTVTRVRNGESYPETLRRRFEN